MWAAICLHRKSEREQLHHFQISTLHCSQEVWRSAQNITSVRLKPKLVEHAEGWWVKENWFVKHWVDKIQMFKVNGCTFQWVSHLGSHITYAVVILLYCFVWFIFGFISVLLPFVLMLDNTVLGCFQSVLIPTFEESLPGSFSLLLWWISLDIQTIS